MNGKKMYIAIALIVIAIGLAALYEYIFGGTDGRKDRNSPESRIDESVGRLGNQQQRASEAIRRAEQGLDDGLGRIDDFEVYNRQAERTVSSLEERLKLCQERNAECQRITRRSESRIAEYRKLCERPGE
ncbi:MAG: hypothetical protein K6F62_01590 [Schwartzia sp.]|nr:hypothetical protein [Schwartzia sp. (in: firmicutes)]